MDKFRSESTARMRPCPISYSLLLVPVFSGVFFHPIVLLITHPSAPDFANSLWNFSPSKNGCCTLKSKGFRNLGKGLRLVVSQAACGVVRNGCTTAWSLLAGNWADCQEFSPKKVTWNNQILVFRANKQRNTKEIHTATPTEFSFDAGISLKGCIYHPSIPEISFQDSLDFNESRKFNQNSLLSNSGSVDQNKLLEN